MSFLRLFRNNLNIISLVISVIALGLVLYQYQSIQHSKPVVAKSEAFDAEGIVQKINPQAPIMGDETAPVTVVELGDFQCQFCKMFYDRSFKNLIEKYSAEGKIKFVFVDYPFLGEESKLAAEGGMCAQDQNQFWSYYKYLYEHQGLKNQGNFRTSQLMKFGSKLPLNQDKFSDCLKKHIHAQDVGKIVNVETSLAIGGTPTFYINKDKYRGAKSLAYYKDIIDKLLTLHK